MNPIKNEIGNKYGKLTVLKQGTNSQSGAIKWICLCECGNETEVLGYSLRKGITTACGCNMGRKEEFKGSSVYKKTYNVLKRVAKKHKEELELGFKEWMDLIKQDCYYCGLPPNDVHFAYSKKRYSKGVENDNSEKFNGIDRINSSIGYTKNNTVSCCNMCNRMKSDFNKEIFLKQIKLIYENRKSK
jgi:hypothetical protein